MVLKTKGSASFFTRNYKLSLPPVGGGGMTDAGASSAEIPLIRGFLLKKADAADGTGSEDQIQLFRALSTALFRSAEHALEAITMTTRSPLEEMMAFSTLLCACANSA